MRLRGAFTALVTPFRAGDVDLDALRALVERQIVGGVQGLVPCGTTGESATLDPGEHAAVVGAVVEQARGRVPVLAGVGTSDTRRTVALAERARGLGVDGLLVACPAYNRPTQAGLEAHFRALAAAVPLPTMLYDVPARTGVALELETLARLADVPSIVALKEASGNVVRAQRVLARLGERFDVFAGDDALALSIMALGGAGVVSVTANLLPDAVARVADAMRAGDLPSARAAHLRLLPLHEAMFVETNPGPIKAMMADAKLLHPEVRLPLVWPSDESLALARAALAQAVGS
ncbi:MAG: 4-hydroxy-tetrahydrodipicolinate synthase [Myxococcales bacterium]|nr:4-hydroxy-tetrahydrodipicolinate synthase [Myxococcales bacterium]